jgi:hypothetical protein
VENIRFQKAPSRRNLSCGISIVSGYACDADRSSMS